jgi:hypothetical protein
MKPINYSFNKLNRRLTLKNKRNSSNKFYIGNKKIQILKDKSKY